MSFVIGNSNTNNVGSSNTLKFNNAVIYDMGNWTESGTLAWDATTGNFTVVPSEELHAFFLKQNKSQSEPKEPKVDVKFPNLGAMKIPKKNISKR
jgi:hypothetical protein